MLHLRHPPRPGCQSRRILFDLDLQATGYRLGSAVLVSHRTHGKNVSLPLSGSSHAAFVVVHGDVPSLATGLLPVLFPPGKVRC